MVKKDAKIAGGILLLFAGFFVIAQSNKEMLSLLIGLGISAIGVYLILSSIN
ncbi:hypothetical protein HYW74_01395 [Candidatus Pacearchaeota archaeon]|nr:hypothetical protein [Candidatus Pacearchaeota archaeon]